MDEYYRILESLPPALRTPLAKLDAHYAPHIQEIRLRLGQPVQFTICGRLCPAAKFLPGSGLPAALETDTLRDCFLQLCRRSVYAYEDELKQGYFTVQGGCRIGVAGCRGPGGSGRSGRSAGHCGGSGRCVGIFCVCALTKAFRRFTGQSGNQIGIDTAYADLSRVIHAFFIIFKGMLATDGSQNIVVRRVDIS